MYDVRGKINRQKYHNYVFVIHMMMNVLWELKLSIMILYLCPHELRFVQINP